MITLNHEKRLVRVESWDDVISRPGFAASIDPKTVTLKEIIGSYNFDTMIPCGLSTCHQPHGTGFLVVTADGRETNLGRICGKRHFSVEFTQMSRVFLRAVRAQQDRELLHALNHRLPAVAAEVATLKTGSYGAGWVSQRVNLLLGVTAVLPRPVINAVREAVRRGDGSLTKPRATTQEERDAFAAAVDVTGLERRNRLADAVEERVGQLDGFAALAPGNALKDLLAAIEPLLSQLPAVDIDSLPESRLRDLAKQAGELDANMDRLRTTIEVGRRLLTKQNVRQLTAFTTNPSEVRTMHTLLADLP